MEGTTRPWFSRLPHSLVSSSCPSCVKRVSTGGYLESEHRLWLEVLVGGVLLTATMVVHGLGMYCVVTAAKHMLGARHEMRQHIHVVRVVSILIVLTLATHLLDIMLWAVALDAMHLVSPVRHAVHFAALTYTTLGAPTSLPEQWLLLEAGCAVAGTLTFAWTTAVMFQFLNRLFDWHSNR